MYIKLEDLISYGRRCFYSNHIIQAFVSTTSRAGQPGGGSFKEKNYTPKKECAYRMCTRRPTNAMPKPSFVCVHQPLAPFGGGVLVVAGCVSVVRRFGDVKNHLRCDVVTSVEMSEKHLTVHQ